MTVKSIPYGDRAVLVAENFVYICDKILLKADFETAEDLMKEVDRIYNEYKEACNGK